MLYIKKLLISTLTFLSLSMAFCSEDTRFKPDTTNYQELNERIERSESFLREDDTEQTKKKPECDVEEILQDPYWENRVIAASLKLVEALEKKDFDSVQQMIENLKEESKKEEFQGPGWMKRTGIKVKEGARSFFSFDTVGKLLNMCFFQLANAVIGLKADCLVKSFYDETLEDNANIKNSISNKSKTYLLKELNRNHTNLQDFPSSLLSCFNLKRLYLSHNNITSLPKQINMLSKLKILDLSSNPYLENLPMELSDLKNLQILDISDTNVSINHPTIKALLAKNSKVKVIKNDMYITTAQFNTTNQNKEESEELSHIAAA